MLIKSATAVILYPLLPLKVEDQRKTIASISQQPTCSPAFRRFLTRFLMLINKVGVVGYFKWLTYLQ